MEVFYRFLLFSPALCDKKAWSWTESRGKKDKAGKTGSIL